MNEKTKAVVLLGTSVDTRQQKQTINTVIWLIAPTFKEVTKWKMLLKLELCSLTNWGVSSYYNRLKSTEYEENPEVSKFAVEWIIENNYSYLNCTFQFNSIENAAIAYSEFDENTAFLIRTCFQLNLLSIST